MFVKEILTRSLQNSVGEFDVLYSARGARCMVNSFQNVADASFQHTVLIAEDEPLIRMAYAEFLSDCGFFPIAVHNGDAAVELLQKRVAIDIVLSDIRMPGMRDGFEVARWLIQNRPNIPVILITGNSGKSEMPPDLAGVPILRKPVDMDVIVQKIREAIEMHWERAG
jgi:two-component system, response regulator PdtaR